MKAIVYTEYGPPEVLRLKEIGKPVPKDNEVLVRIHAVAVTAGDAIMRSGKFPPAIWLPARLVFGLRKPKRTILGMEFAGEVEAVGKAVTRFTTGDRVFGMSGMGFGAYVEFKCVPEDGPLLAMPKGLSYEEGAAVPIGGTTASFFLRKANIRPGQKVLIYGASGSVGSYAVQIARHLGAEVTGVCSTGNFEMVKSLGADKVIDYTKEDFSKSGEQYDVIYDTLGISSFPDCIRALAPKGKYLLNAVWNTSNHFRAMWTSMTSGRKVISGTAPDSVEELKHLRELIEAGKVKPFIDKRFPLERISEAHAIVDSKRKRGNIVLTVAHKTE